MSGAFLPFLFSLVLSPKFLLVYCSSRSSSQPDRQSRLSGARVGRHAAFAIVNANISKTAFRQHTPPPVRPSTNCSPTFSNNNFVIGSNSPIGVVIEVIIIIRQEERRQTRRRWRRSRPHHHDHSDAPRRTPQCRCVTHSTSSNLNARMRHLIIMLWT